MSRAGERKIKIPDLFSYGGRIWQSFCPSVTIWPFQTHQPPASRGAGSGARNLAGHSRNVCSLIIFPIVPGHFQETGLAVQSAKRHRDKCQKAHPLVGPVLGWSELQSQGSGDIHALWWLPYRECSISLYSRIRQIYLKLPASWQREGYFKCHCGI